MHGNPGLNGNLPVICAVDQFALIGTGNLQLLPDESGTFSSGTSAVYPASRGSGHL